MVMFKLLLLLPALASETSQALNGSESGLPLLRRRLPNTLVMEGGHKAQRAHHGNPHPEHHDLHLGHSRTGLKSSRPRQNNNQRGRNQERNNNSRRNSNRNNNQNNCFLGIFCRRRLERRRLPNTLVMEGGHKAQRAHHGKAHPDHHDLHLGHARTGLKSSQPRQNNQQNRNNGRNNNRNNRNDGKLCLFGVCLP